MNFHKFSNHFERKVDGEVRISKGWVRNVIGKKTREMESRINGSA